MKFLIVLAFVAVASAATLPQKRISQAELDEIVAAIHSPSTHPDTAAALEQMLQDLLGAASPIQVGPAVVEPVEEIGVGPAIIDPVEEISVGPAVIDPVEEISVGPALIEEPAINPLASNNPLVQVLVIVNSGASNSIVITQPGLGTVDEELTDEIKPDPVVVADAPEAAVIAPEPVNVGSPIFPDLAINLPEALN
ncbi:uncharacterized protein LOC123698909 isoform X1 [Colias croceus]|uniref:uncharacterized protein LOC123698909 isoform X1 n=1 Tax=Colias crocea TaxID=72248 RepID=UPI001E27CE10|nr:uncharacterized protein LOC123698909 isoform X1 [Colias croceus]